MCLWTCVLTEYINDLNDTPKTFWRNYHHSLDAPEFVIDENKFREKNNDIETTLSRF